MTTAWIAEEPVVFLRPDGQRIAGRIVVGQPERVETGEARCAVLLEGLEQTLPIHGESTLQALLLGVRFLGMRLHDFRSKGGRIVDPEDDSDVELEALFGPLLRDP